MLKRGFDLVVGTLLILISFPLMMCIWCTNRFIFGRSIFSQFRTGRNEKPFQILKFQSMHDDGRIPVWGKFIRRSGMDELPQLLLVVSGKMSLVGPRPLPCEYLPFHSDQEKKRYCLKPGITGLAQVRGRNLLSWEEKFRYDLIYKERSSVVFDLVILWETCMLLFSYRDEPVPERLDSCRNLGML